MVWLYGHTIIQSNKLKNVSKFDALDCYLMSFISNNDVITTQLQVLSNDTLLDSVHMFHTSVPSGCRMKAGLTKLTMDDFQQQTNELPDVPFDTPTPDDQHKTQKRERRAEGICLGP